MNEPNYKKNALLRAESPPIQPKYGWRAVLLFSAIFFFAMLPGLHRLEFFDGVEHFNLATVQEMKRDGGNWLLPTLEGEPRVVKPPLTAWLTAATVSPGTVAALHDTDPAARAEAFSQFVFYSRLPTILCATFMLVGVYQLGSVVADRRTGLIAAMICSGCLLFLYQGRRATTDLQLAVWVTWTNALLATALIDRRYRWGLMGAGLMLGLAMLAKGPHIALLLTIVPAIAYLLFQRFSTQQPAGLPTSVGSANPRPTRFIVVGLLIAFTIGLIWYAYVLWKVPGVMDQWLREMFRKNMQIGRNTMRPDPWYAYGSIFSQLMPWTPWVLWGGWIAFHDRRRRQLLLPLITLILPLIVMSFFGEKKTRYLLPFVGPAAVLAAGAFSQDSVSSDDLPTPKSALRPWVELLTLLSAIWISIGVPLVGLIGVKGFRTWDDHPWFTPTLAIPIAIIAAITLILGLTLSRRSPIIWLVAIVLVTWLGSEMRLRGETLVAGDPDDRPQHLLADQIWQTYPTAKILAADSPTLYGQLNRAAIVLSIYADRIVYTRPETLPTQSAGQALILITDSIDEVPPVPPGWKRWQELPLRVGRRYVDVLE